MHTRIVLSLLAGVFSFGISGWVFPPTIWAAEESRKGESPTATPLIIHLSGVKADAAAVPEATGNPADQVDPAPSAANGGTPDTVSAGDRGSPPAGAGNESAVADSAAPGSTDTTEPAAVAPESAGTTEAPADPQAASGDSANPAESDPAAGAQSAQTPEGGTGSENAPAPEVETEAPRSPRILLY